MTGTQVSRATTAGAAASLLGAGALASTAFLSSAPKAGQALRANQVVGDAGAFAAQRVNVGSSSSGNVVGACGLALAGAAAAALHASARRVGGVSGADVRAVNLARCAFENELGVQAPVGYWDPLGLSKDGDEAKFKRRRATELKNGRVAMYAAIGYIVPEYFRFPGYLSPSQGLKFTDVPNGLEALSKVPIAGGLQIFFFIGALEKGLLSQDPTRAPGDFEGWGNLGVPLSEDIQDPEARKRGLNSELANGRLAMAAITGMMFQNGFIGTTGPEMWLPSGAFEGELGVQPPLGYFDPLGLSKDGDVDKFYRRRCTEIKHGRVAMWAAMGYIVPEYFRWPGDCSTSLGLKFTDIENGFGAFATVPAAGWAQMFAFAGFLELYAAKQDPSDPPGKLTGNDEGFGRSSFGRLGLYKADGISDPAAKKRALNSELANGRLAMFAIMGMMFQNGVTGTTGPEMWVPAGAFEAEAGVQAPVGFWDPLGYSKDGNTDAFLRRRETEIKHGRVSMYATIGYIVPEYFRWPGDLSPSMGLKFTDVPNGLAAISKVPAAGWSQITAFLGFYELFVYKYSGEPGNYGRGFLGVAGPIADPEVRKRKLSSEIANGRLAMAAIIGMFFQDGLTGSAWGDWA